MKPRDLRKLLLSLGFVLERHGSKHDIYRHPSGVMEVVSFGTKSTDPRAVRNARARLRRAGII